MFPIHSLIHSSKETLLDEALLPFVCSTVSSCIILIIWWFCFNRRSSEIENSQQYEIKQFETSTTDFTDTITSLNNNNNNKQNITNNVFINPSKSTSTSSINSKLPQMKMNYYNSRASNEKYSTSKSVIRAKKSTTTKGFKYANKKQQKDKVNKASKPKLQKQQKNETKKKRRRRKSDKVFKLPNKLHSFPSFVDSYRGTSVVSSPVISSTDSGLSKLYRS